LSGMEKGPSIALGDNVARALNASPLLRPLALLTTIEHAPPRCRPQDPAHGRVRESNFGERHTPATADRNLQGAPKRTQASAALETKSRHRFRAHIQDRNGTAGHSCGKQFVFRKLTRRKRLRKRT